MMKLKYENLDSIAVGTRMKIGEVVFRTTEVNGFNTVSVQIIRGVEKRHDGCSAVLECFSPEADGDGETFQGSETFFALSNEDFTIETLEVEILDK